jgi:perosamine synthetase
MDNEISQIAEQLKALTIPDSASLRDAMRQLNVNGAGNLFVVDPAFRLVGMLTDGDIRRRLLEECSLDTGVVDVMNRNFRFVREGESPDQRRLSAKIKYLPVVDARDRLVDFFVLEARPDIPVAKPLLAGNEAAYVAECISTNWISSQGRFVRRFEHDFAAFCDVEHGVATCNGTAALHLALAALDIGPGDEVIVPSLTFIATANSVRYTGATPVFGDCEQDTWNLDPAEIARLVTPRTKAVIVVHLYGQPARMDEIMAAGEQHGLTIIEDAAEAHGALYKGRRVGGIGHLGCFSFFGNKIVTTGEGGMVVCNSGRLADRLRILRDHGMDPDRRYWHPWIGFNYRMTNLQAAVGCAQMERIDEILESKRRAAQWYADRLAGTKGLTMPPANDWSQSVYWMFSVLIDDGPGSLSRDLVLQRLTERKVEGRPFFFPAHQMPPYEAGLQLANTEALSRKGLNLPSYVGLTESEVEQVCIALIDILSSGAA